MCAAIFSDNKEFNAEEFFKWRDHIQEALWHFEFHQYPLEEVDGELKMKMEDFVRSNLIFLPWSQVKMYMNRIRSNEEFSNQHVSFNEYVSWQFFVKYIEHALLQVNEFRLINHDRFVHLIRLHEKDFKRYKLTPISDNQVNAMFYVLDLDQNQVLDLKEIQGVFLNRIKLGHGKDEEYKDAIKDSVLGLLKQLREKIGI